MSVSASILLWLEGAALKQQRLDGSVALLPSTAQRHFIVRVDISAPVEEEPDHLQTTFQRSVHQRLAIPRLNICAAIKQESNYLQVATLCSQRKRLVLLRMHIRAPVEQERCRGQMSEFCRLDQHVSILVLNVSSAVQKQSHDGCVAVARCVGQRRVSLVSVGVEERRTDHRVPGAHCPQERSPFKPSTIFIYEHGRGLHVRPPQ